MGYDHSLNAGINFKPAVSMDDVFSCLHPLLDYFGWTGEDILENRLEYDNSFEITENGDAVQHLSIYTSGEVGDSFPDVVQAFAKHLAPLAKPGVIELRDRDTGDLENAIHKIWYGNPDQVVQAQRLHAWHEACELLRAVGIAEETITLMAIQGGFAQAAAGA